VRYRGVGLGDYRLLGEAWGTPLRSSCEAEGPTQATRLQKFRAQEGYKPLREAWEETIIVDLPNYVTLRDYGITHWLTVNASN